MNSKNTITSKNTILQEIESGIKAVITKHNNEFTLHSEVKEAIIAQFAGTQNIMTAGDFAWNDKIEWLNAAKDERAKHFRMCPGAWIRKGVFIGEKVIFMPCFVNVGAHIGNKTMIDSGVTVGSCAYIGERCHISSNTIIAGVLEPIQAKPCVIDDDCFIGSQCLVAEGVVVESGCVIAAGTRLTQSTRIYDRETGEYSFGKVPANSVVVPGSYSVGNDLNVSCAIIVKQVSSELRQKTSIHELLRS